jgi:hypothetical protein
VVTARWSIGTLQGRCQLLDVSEAGLRLRCERASLRLYGRITLTFPLPSLQDPGQEELCRVQGVVVWIEEREAGVSLIDPPAEVQARLRALYT